MFLRLPPFITALWLTLCVPFGANAAKVEIRPTVTKAVEGGIPLPGTETGLARDETDELIDDTGEDGPSDPASEKPADAGPPPAIQTDLDALPEPVRKTRRAILDAIATGEVEALRDVIGTGEDATSLSIGGLDGDPIAFLKDSSGDGEGLEILAILKEVLETGYVHMDVGTEFELYVWPYFFGVPLDTLSGPQKVELYTILTAGEVQDSQQFGSYVFYRVGIAPDGRWAFFVSGD